MNLAQADFQQLRIKHILFKSKVRAMLYGSAFDPAFFSPAGPVGQWFNTTGHAKYSREPEIQSLLSLQQELNRYVADMHRLYNAGQIDEASEGLKVVEKKSDEFLGLVSQLEKRMAV